MISTVTISTITTIATAGLAAGLGIFVIVLLIGLLAGKELLGGSAGKRQKLLARSLYIGIVPLIICFAVIVGLKVAEILT
jgi:hypothetical protein